MEGQCRLKINIPGFQDAGAVSLMYLCKNVLFMTLGSQRNMYKSALGKLDLLTIALCTLSPNISAPRQKKNFKLQGCWDAVSLMSSPKLFF